MNIIQICLVIFVVSAIAFRSLLAGVIVLTPLLLAVCAVFGVMGLAGIPLNIPNSLISAMAVGIGADYAIYLLYRMREQVAKGADAEAAVAPPWRPLEKPACSLQPPLPEDTPC